MFSFIRRALRPIAMIGEKVGNIFKIGRKAEVIKDVRNTEPFLNLAGEGLRFRPPPPEVRGMDGGFYGDMNSMLRGFKYPVG